MITEDNTPLLRQIALVVLLGGLVLLSYSVLRPFLVPVIWALILAYVTWPLFLRLRRLLRERVTVSALIMTLVLTAAFVVPVLWLVSLLRVEVTLGYAELARFLATRPRLPETLANIPWLGGVLQEFLDRMSRDPEALRTEAAALVDQSIGEIRSILGGVGRNLAKTFFALLTLFFMYRNGESLALQVRDVLERVLGERVHAYLQATGDTTRAVVYGIVLAAFAQGFLAALGYWAAGLQAPVVLGAATALIALIPFGAPLIWASAGIWLLITDRTGAGIGLLLWGVFAVSWVDNLVRPLVISNATRIPFLLVMFGVLGGIAAFGLVGLFLGPVILAVLMAVWREWLHLKQVEVRVTPPRR
ncbi:MAG: AI-2E family transporter [Gammaproteobacteria bacterium]|nr:AI-2E family transporter [Gammaproteobacteria bacterium]